MENEIQIVEAPSVKNISRGSLCSLLASSSLSSPCLPPSPRRCPAPCESTPMATRLSACRWVVRLGPYGVDLGPLWEGTHSLGMSRCRLPESWDKVLHKPSARRTELQMCAFEWLPSVAPGERLLPSTSALSLSCWPQTHLLLGAWFRGRWIWGLPRGGLLFSEVNFDLGFLCCGHFVMNTRPSSVYGPWEQPFHAGSGSGRFC